MVDDIPVLVSKFEESGLVELLNKHFKVHGNWGGVSFGETVLIYLTYVLSSGSHQLSHVEQWVEGRLHVLQGSIGNKGLGSEHFRDDRLALMLDYLSLDKHWEDFEVSLNRRLLQVYKLPETGSTIRLDSTVIQSFRESSELFKMGYSKQRRSDLPQVKAMLSTYDPLGMPLTVKVVDGSRADESLYRPSIDLIRKTLSERGQLYVGDVKLGTIETRHHLESGGDYYLSPLALRECSSQQLATYLSNKPQQLSLIEEEDKKGKKSPKALFFEVESGFECVFEGQTWHERRIVVYSYAYGKSQCEALEKRIGKAEVELKDLLKPKQGRKPLVSRMSVEAAVDGICQKYHVEDLLEVQIDQQTTKKITRKYGLKPEQIIETLSFSLIVKRAEEAIEQQKTFLGWRVYATNVPKERLNPQQCIECYWTEYNIEQRFHELHNKITALLPLFIHHENRIVALIRLLIVALKFSCCIQHQIREELNRTNQTINELYPGNPGRKTEKPTTSLILNAFKGIALVIMEAPDGTKIIQMTQLKPIQQKIINMLQIHKAFETMVQFWKTG